MPAVSVIVPARDVEDYLPELLDDLRHQTFTDTQVIVVDDGSADRTGEIAGRVAETDHRFVVLSSAGAGVSAARNLGWQHADGEFLCFVDADDRLAPTYLETLVRTARETGSDLVSCNAHRLDGYRTRPSMLHQRVCATALRRTHLRRTPRLVWDTAVWNKLWRRDMWQRVGIHFTPGRWLNDVLPSIQGHVAARTVDVVTDVLYYWRIRADPATSITDSKHTDPQARLKSLQDRIYALRCARELLAERLPRRPVLHAFDHRILEHDLPAYLPYYTDNPDGYGAVLVREIQDLLQRFGIDPRRYPLGTLLQEVYAAALAGDRDTFAALVDPASGLVPNPTRRQRTALRVPGAGASRSGAGVDHRFLPWALRRAASRIVPLRTPPLLRATAMIDRVTTDPDGGLLIEGAVRVREGRSNVYGDWRAAAAVTLTPPGASRLQPVLQRLGRTGALIADLLATGRPVRAGAASAVGEPTDRVLHPLTQSGWFPYRVHLDVSDLPRPRGGRALVLGLRLHSGRTSVLASPTLTTVAACTLPTGIPVAPGGDLVLRPDPSGRLRLHLSGHTVRLDGIEVDSDLAEAVLAPVAGRSVVESVWLRDPSGGRVPLEARDGGFRLAAAAIRSPGRYELWARADGRVERVRAGAGLVTGYLRDGHGAVALLAPDPHGYVTVEVGPATPYLRSAAGNGATDTVTLAGELAGAEGPEAEGPWKEAEFRCSWSRECVTAPVWHDAGGWRADVRVGDLFRTAAMWNRMWRIQLVDPAGRRVRPHVPVEDRHRYPVAVPVGERTVYLVLDDDCAPALSLIAAYQGARSPNLRWTAPQSPGVAPWSPPDED